MICSTAKKGKGLISGHALSVVTLADVSPMKSGHARAAMVDAYENWDGYYAWTLKNPRPIVPFPVKGKLSLWECGHSIAFLPAPDHGTDLRYYCERFWDSFLYGQ